MAELRLFGEPQGALPGDHDDLTNVTADQHHAQLHAAAHASGGGDPVNHDGLQGWQDTKHRQILIGPLAARPASSPADRFYWATDTKELFRDTGSGWDEVTIAHGDLTGVTADQHHAQGHVLTGPDHTASGLTDGYVLRATGASSFGFEADYGMIEIIIDGGGAAITTGVKADVEVPYACIVEGWTLVADQSGSIVIDVWKDTYANFPPTVADIIADTEKPTLSSAQKNQDLSLTTWTTTLARGDWLRFNVDSAATVQRVTLSLRVRKT